MAEEKENVRVMTRAERNSYEGMTIEAEGEGSGDRPYEYQEKREPPRFYRVYSGGSPLASGLSYTSLLFGTDWRTRLVRLAALVGIGFLLVLFVSFILPVLLGAVGIALAYIFLRRILR